MTDHDPETVCTNDPYSSRTPTCTCRSCSEWREMIAQQRLEKAQPRWGRVTGPIRTEWLEDSAHREMRILEDVVYVDPRGREWRALEGDVINGVGRHWSSAILLWLACLIVPKFVGRHRIPSVFHDVYCDTRTRPSPEVHWMFYECLRCKGVVSIVEWIEWKGVLWFGPRF